MEVATLIIVPTIVTIIVTIVVIPLLLLLANNSSCKRETSANDALRERFPLAAAAVALPKVPNPYPNTAPNPVGAVPARRSRNSLVSEIVRG